MALQTKLVDCQMCGQPYTAYSTFLDVTKMWVQMNTHFQQSFVYMNKKQWESLSPELQQVVQEAVRKYVRRVLRELLKISTTWKKWRKLASRLLFFLMKARKIASKIRKNVWPIMESIITTENMDILRNGLGLAVSQ